MIRLANFVAIIYCVAICGCGAAPRAESGGAAKKFRIAVIPKGTSHDFWNSVRAGVEQAAAEFPELDVIWKGPLSEGNTADQIKIVEDFVADGYDGICLAPLDAIALRKPVDQCLRNKIPVVIFDSGLQDQSGIVSYVATNNYRGGQRAGEHLVELLGGKGRVILMRYDLNSQSTEERERGFLDSLAPHKDIQLLSHDKYAGPDESGATLLAENLLANFGEQVDGIFCPNQSTASGMLTVLERFHLAGKVKFIGFDSGRNLAEGLARGVVHATVLQDPVKMGYDAVRVMYDHLQGKPVPKVVETQEALATTENHGDPKVHALLYPAAAR